MIINEDTKLYVRKFDGSIQFGAFCTLEEAYSNNLLTIENVQTINDNYNNKVQMRGDEYETNWLIDERR